MLKSTTLLLVVSVRLDKKEVDVEVPYNSCKSSWQKEKSTYKSVIRLGKTEDCVLVDLGNMQIDVAGNTITSSGFLLRRV